MLSLVWSTRRAVRHIGGGFEYHPSLLGFTPLSLGFTLSSFGYTLAVGFHPFVVWLYPCRWVSPLCRLVIPSPLGFTPSSLGPTLLVSAPAPPLCRVIAPPPRRVAVAVVIPLAGIEFLPTLSNPFGCHRIHCWIRLAVIEPSHHFRSRSPQCWGIAVISGCRFVLAAGLDASIRGIMTNHNRCCDSYPLTHLMGLLLPGSPLVCSISVKLAWAGPYPFEKGRGGRGCGLASEGAKAVLDGPTSLNRGERLISVSLRVIWG
jgi:hypothetical protein